MNTKIIREGILYKATYTHFDELQLLARILTKTSQNKRKAYCIHSWKTESTTHTQRSERKRHGQIVV